jgi:hypothetical protein
LALSNPSMRIVPLSMHALLPCPGSAPQERGQKGRSSFVRFACLDLLLPGPLEQATWQCSS